MAEERDQDCGPATPDDHGGSADDDAPAIVRNIDKGTAAEVKRLIKRVAPPGKNA